MKTINILLFVILLTNFLLSQVTEEWVARYNGPGNGLDRAYSIATDSSGNIYVTGGSVGAGGYTYFTTIKYNSSGIQQWAARYDSSLSASATAEDMFVDILGNVYVTGGYGGGSYLTIKYDSSGVLQWVAKYDFGSTDQSYSLAVDGSGVYVTGSSKSSITGPYNYATIKYNSSGDSVWVRRYDGPGNGDDNASSIAVDSAGNVYVTGSSSGNGTGSDYATIKYSSTGVQDWVQRYNGPGNNSDAAFSLALDNMGNVYVTGRSNATSSSQSGDYATVKYSSAGVQEWVQRYNGPGNYYDSAEELVVDDSGNVYVTGRSSQDNIGRTDFATIKYNTAGVQQWAQRYNGPNNTSDDAFAISVDNSRNVYVTGSSNGIGSNSDYATVMYSSLGIQKWVQRYNGPGNDQDAAQFIAVDGSGNVYITGYSWGSGTSSDYATIKYSQPNGIHQISNEVPKEFSLSQNYPNPFNPSTNIKFQIPAGGFILLTVYDILGRKAAVLVNEKLSAGTYEVKWDASNYPSGVYFYKLSSGGFSKTMKMVLLK
jgi:hypothetical protein